MGAKRQSHRETDNQGRETRDLPPDVLEPHPERTDFPADEERGEIEAVEEGVFRQNPKVTRNSHYTEADWTIVSGHRRIETARKRDWDKALVDVVGPYNTPEEERQAVHDYNDHRTETPGEQVNFAYQRLKDWHGEPLENLPRGSDTRNRLDGLFRVGGRTIEKGLKVKWAAERGEFPHGEWEDEKLPKEAREVSENQWRALLADEARPDGAKESIENELVRHERAQRRQERRESMAGKVSFVDDPDTPDELEEKGVVFPLPGGKKKLASWIISKMPPHRTYVEPFGGGASVLQTKPPSVAEVYNDLDADMATFFRVLSERPEVLQTRLQPVNFTDDRYDEWTRPFYDGWQPNDDVKRAAVFFFSRHAQWGGKHGGIAGFNEDRRADYHRKRARLPEFAERFEDVEVEGRDYSEVLAEYDGPYTLFYCDPPYVGTEHRYQAGGDFDHDAFAKRLTQLEGKWIVSYGEEIPDELEEYRQEVREATRGMSSGKPSLETLVMNYPEDEEGAYKGGDWTADADKADWS